MADGNLRLIFRKYLPMVHWTTIETSFAEPGVPDMNGCLRGHEFWVENKWTDGWRVTMRPEQVGWLLRRTRAGGCTFVAVRRHCAAGARRPAADELWLLQGARAAELKERGLRHTPALGQWAGGPPRWGWGQVAELLVK
jgi:hypothetical protein